MRPIESDRPIHHGKWRCGGYTVDWCGSAEVGGGGRCGETAVVVVLRRSQIICDISSLSVGFLSNKSREQEDRRTPAK